MNQKLYDCYVSILKRELVPAMGCTEPIAIAYAGALARQTLGKMPEHVELIVSGNIIKNVKSVIVPHTGGRGTKPYQLGGAILVASSALIYLFRMRRRERRYR